MLFRTKHAVNFPLILFLCSVYSESCLAVIYQLNETEYQRMPPVFLVEPYEECTQEPAGVYCALQAALVADGDNALMDLITVIIEYQRMPPVFLAEPYEECTQEPAGVYCALQAALVADGDNALMDLITEYSAHTVGHYNHSLLRYNLCITTSCKEFIDNTTTDLVHALEACLNKTFEDKYGLKTKLSENDVHCKKVNEKIQMEIADLFMIALLIGILLLTLVGSLYDIIFTNGRKEEGNFVLTSFSIRRNWRKLVSLPFEGSDSKLERIKVISCVKFLSMVSVIVVHSTISIIYYIDNTQYMEDLIKTPGFQFMASATIAIQNFFIVSGFLLSYNLELMSERDSFKLNWMLVPKGFMLRWIRLTPTYAFVLFFMMTMNKYCITGPHWHVAVIAEIEDCKKFWWQHLLYINNYNDVSQCMMPSWYLACDAQLCVLGLVIYVACRSAASRKVVLSVLLLVATLIPVGHTYWQDLNGLMVGSPESIMRFFVGDPTFTYLYKRSHTNIVCYLVGLGVGFLAYHGQKVNYDVQKYRKYRVLFYSLFPLALVVIMSGCIFYRDGPRPSLAVRMLFAAYQKPVWGLILGTMVLAVIFKHEELLRGFVEWRGWTPLSRLSYSAYLLHTIVLRAFVAANAITHATSISLVEHMLFILVVTYLAALPTWLLVEQPAGRLLSALLRRPRDNKHHDAETMEENEEDKKNALDVQLTRV